MVIVLALSSCYSSQVIPISFEEPLVKVYDINGTKDDLFMKANLWMVATFKDPRSIIQYSDKTEGLIAGKYLLKYIPVNGGHIMGQYKSLEEEYIYALIEIRLKDSKALISIKPDSWEFRQSFYPNKKPVVTVGGYTKEQAIKDMDDLCKSFYQRMKSADVAF
jgi:hypothetical protein